MNTNDEKTDTITALGVRCTGHDSSDGECRMWNGEKIDGVRVVVQELRHAPALEAGDPRWSVAVILSYQHDAADGAGDTFEEAEADAREQLRALVAPLADLAA